MRLALTVTTSSLPGGTVGTAYSQALAASGGTPPYTWALATGTLPAGLTLSTGGTISGTPSAAGSSTFTVRATDSASQSATASLTVTINAPALTVATSSLPGGTVGAPYSQALAASGGTPPYTWIAASGALPAGLTFSTGGTISGTPLAAGSFAFSLRVADSSGSSSHFYRFHSNRTGRDTDHEVLAARVNGRRQLRSDAIGNGRRIAIFVDRQFRFSAAGPHA